MAAHLEDRRLLGAFAVAATLFFGFIGVFTYLPYLLAAPPFSLSTGAIAWFYASYAAGVSRRRSPAGCRTACTRRALIAAGFAVAIAGMLLTLVHTRSRRSPWARRAVRGDVRSASDRAGLRERHGAGPRRPRQLALSGVLLHGRVLRLDAAGLRARTVRLERRRRDLRGQPDDRPGRGPCALHGRRRRRRES
jgi:hypothetical protein